MSSTKKRGIDNSVQGLYNGDKTGKVWKIHEKRLSLLLALVFCLGLVPFASADNSPFSDVPSDHWAYDAVMETYNDGVMTGTATGVFSPSGKLNMNQFFTVLTRAFTMKKC